MSLTVLLLLAAAAVPCRAVDGDTLRCGRERVRLLGIDAPELPGHCRRGRRCVPGNPEASRDSLAAMVRRPVTLTRYGHDHYGRTLATARVPAGDLACRQIAAGYAVYVRRYDRRGLVARRCGLATR